MKKTTKRGLPWTDKEFKPHRSSLYNAQTDSLTAAQRRYYDSLEWRRASEIYRDLIMNDGMVYSVDDFEQGEVTHNYILAYLD